MRRSLPPLSVIFQTNAPPAGHTKGSEGAASAGVPPPAPARLLAATAGGVKARAQVRGGDDSSTRDTRAHGITPGRLGPIHFPER